MEELLRTGSELLDELDRTGGAYEKLAHLIGNFRQALRAAGETGNASKIEATVATLDPDAHPVQP